MSLLDDAKKLKVKKRASNLLITQREEILELAMGWVKDEVSPIQIGKVLGREQSNIYSILALALKEHIKNTTKK